MGHPYQWNDFFYYAACHLSSQESSISSPDLKEITAQPFSLEEEQFSCASIPCSLVQSNFYLDAQDVSPPSLSLPPPRLSPLSLFLFFSCHLKSQQYLLSDYYETHFLHLFSLPNNPMKFPILLLEMMKLELRRG